ncbi:MAG: hypothetical protein ACJ8DC_17600 [Gemmatimonadales bacterium]
MADFTQGSARTRIAIPDRLAGGELAKLTQAGAVILDQRRRRPRYFDGRFLVAQDLISEQNYFLARQADLGRAGGFGVIHGMGITQTGARTIRIAAGHGVTPSGDLVVLSRDVEVDLADLATSQQLSAAFGLLQRIHEPGGTRSGLYVLAIRSVEFSAHPIASYPTTLDGERRIEDGDLIEGAAITLIPYGDRAGPDELDLRRSAVAREIFVQADVQGLPSSALPVALLALDRGVIRWADAYLVRREVGAEHGDILGMGFAPRALREAHLLQYNQQLDEVIAQRQAGNRSPTFAASDHFLALPAAGRMPVSAINPKEFTQSYFPPEMEVELSAVPDDELAALIEDSLLLPPIDLVGERDNLDATAVLVLIPVPRPKIRALRAAVPDLVRPLKAAAPGLIARRLPVEALLLLRPTLALTPPVGQAELADAEWQNALAKAPTLWYMRRRTLNFRAEATGSALRIHTNEVADEQELVSALKSRGLLRRFQSLKSVASAEADAELVSLLSSPKFALSRTLIEGALEEMREAHRSIVEAAPPTDPEVRPLLDSGTVLKVAQRYSDPEFGSGMVRLEAATPELKDNDKFVKTVSRAALVPQLDLIGRRLPDSELPAFAAEVLAHGLAGRTEPLAKLINVKLAEIVR